MKILYLNPAGKVGGAERVLLDLIASLRALNPGWSLCLIAAADGELIEDARRLGVETRVMAFPPSLAVVGDAGAGGPAGSGAGWWRVMGRLSASSPAVARYVRELHRAISELQPDVIHSNGLKMHLLGAWAVPGSTPLLWHVHDFIQARPLMRRLMRMHASRCTIVVANSKSVAEDTRAAFGENRPIQTVYNAVDLQRFAPYGAKFDLDGAAGLAYPEGGTVRVGLIATAARWKGHDLFMRALARIPAGLPIRGYIIGGPIYQTEASQFSLDELRETAIRLGISDKIGFTGLVREVPAVMRALDIVVHASISPEPFGLVIAEALACGRAVLTNGIGGAGELIRQGRDAMLFRAGDTDSLADEITQLARDAPLRRKLGQAARATAEQRFARKRMGSEFAEIYRQIAAEEAPRSDAAATRP